MIQFAKRKRKKSIDIKAIKIPRDYGFKMGTPNEFAYEKKSIQFQPSDIKVKEEDASETKEEHE